MRTKFIVSTLTGIIVLCSSCLNLYQPVFSENELIRNDVIVGDWKSGNKLIHIEPYSTSRIAEITNIQIGASNENKLTDREKDSINFSKTYVLSYSFHQSVYYYSFEFGLAGKSFFAQLMPLARIPEDQRDTESRYNAFTGGEVLGTYGIARVDFSEKNKLTLEFIDGEKVREKILNGKAKIPYAYDEVFNNFLITAEGGELVKLLDKYGNDERIYSSEHSYHCTKSQ